MTASAIIFDCDGVLVNSEALIIAVERRFLAEIGLVYDDVDYMTRFVGTSDRDFVAALRADHAVRGTGAFPPDFLERVRAACYDRFTTDLRAVDGLEAYLARLARPKAVASSSTVRSLARKLALTGLAPWFGAHVYSAEHVARGKPAPDLFLHAAERLGVAPADCVVVEDSVNGVRAGVAAGMRVWGFTGGGHGDEGLAGRLADAGAAVVFARFADMPR
ncbi:MAG: HAD family phosphatase [Alphaproteobacteria bacterium]|nr:HAD family phosphatase [Alphaproteobacteria bacterium]MCB9929090.1 HAD family phosphatase [Alphaproteobacteria bacterium]